MEKTVAVVPCDRLVTGFSMLRMAPTKFIMHLDEATNESRVIEKIVEKND